MALRKKGDIFFEVRLPSSSMIIGDVTITHPVTGNPSSAASVVGTWHSRTLRDCSSSKNTKNKDYYSSLGAVFVPLVVSTFGVMHDDFVR